jgi:ketosteroid isomerase-like protein
VAALEIETVALRRLVDGYARAVDRGDVDGFVELFEPDAVLQVFYRGEGEGPPTESRGHARIGEIPTRVQTRYDRTFHFVGNHLCDVHGDEATGEAYCLAHHLTRGPQGGTDYVMHIRYQDVYRRRPGEAWRIAHRKVLVDWTELRTALPAAAATGSAGAAATPTSGRPYTT